MQQVCAPLLLDYVKCSKSFAEVAIDNKKEKQHTVKHNTENHLILLI